MILTNRDLIKAITVFAGICLLHGSLFAAGLLGALSLMLVQTEMSILRDNSIEDFNG